MTTPDGTDLTPEEWEAVRRLRERSGADRPAPAEEPVAVEEPVVVEEPAAQEPAAPDEPAASEGIADEPVAGGPGPLAHVGVVAVAALTALAVAAVALLVVASIGLSDRHADRSNATAALAAATSGVATVLSYNYKSLDADFAKAEALLTPGFRKTYETTTAKAVQPLAAKYKAVSTAQVSAGAVVSTSGSHVQVVLFVAQQVTNTQLAAPRLDRSRIVVDMQKSGTRWLISKLTPV